ncbi:MAG: hypothetical protein ACFFEY_19625 [Candidatus Thorarchaeota archaeon]
MNLKFSENYVYLFGFMGIILYVILIGFAMLAYPGGIRENPSIDGYSFWGNTFSDLGRITAWNGENNLISMILFTFAYGIHIITLIPFYLKFMKIFSKSGLKGKTSKIGSYFGIISSIAFVGILFTPSDILNTIHWIFVFIGYPSLLIMGIFYSITLYFSNQFSKKFAYIFIVIIIFYSISLLIGLIGMSFSRNIMIIGQKIMRLALLLDFSLLIYGAWKIKEF